MESQPIAPRPTRSGSALRRTTVERPGGAQVDAELALRGVDEAPEQIRPAAESLEHAQVHREGGSAGRRRGREELEAHRSDDDERQEVQGADCGAGAHRTETLRDGGRDQDPGQDPGASGQIRRLHELRGIDRVEVARRRGGQARAGERERRRGGREQRRGLRNPPRIEQHEEEEAADRGDRAVRLLDSERRAHGQPQPEREGVARGLRRLVLGGRLRRRRGGALPTSRSRDAEQRRAPQQERERRVQQDRIAERPAGAGRQQHPEGGCCQ